MQRHGQFSGYEQANQIHLGGILPLYLFRKRHGVANRKSCPIYEVGSQVNVPDVLRLLPDGEGHEYRAAKERDVAFKLRHDLVRRMKIQANIVYDVRPVQAAELVRSPAARECRSGRVRIKPIAGGSLGGATSSRSVHMTGVSVMCNLPVVPHFMDQHGRPFGEHLRIRAAWTGSRHSGIIENRAIEIRMIT